MCEKTFMIKFKGDINEDQLEDVIFQGLQYYEDIEWTNYSALKIEEAETYD